MIWICYSCALERNVCSSMRTRNDNQHLSLLSPPQVMSHLQAQLIFDCQLVNQFQNNHKLAKLLPNDSEFESTVRVDRLPHRKWKETKQQPGNMLGCCLVSFHFLWAILWPRAPCIIIMSLCLRIKLCEKMIFYVAYAICLYNVCCLQYTVPCLLG